MITEVHNTVTEAIAEIVEKDIKPEDIRLDKELLYDKHTLKDTYPAKRHHLPFPMGKIKERLALLRISRESRHNGVSYRIIKTGTEKRL